MKMGKTGTTVVFLALAAGLVLAGFTGCAKKVAAPREFKIWHYESDTGAMGIAWAEAMKQFQAKHPDVKIVFETKGFEQIRQTAQMILNSEDAPDILEYNKGNATAGLLSKAGPPDRSLQGSRRPQVGQDAQPEPPDDLPLQPRRESWVPATGTESRTTANTSWCTTTRTRSRKPASQSRRPSRNSKLPARSSRKREPPRSSFPAPSIRASTSSTSSRSRRPTAA